MGEKLLRWLAEHDCALYLHNNPDTRSTVVEIRTNASSYSQLPSLYAGSKLSSTGLNNPNAILDTIERLVEQIERASNAR